MPSLLPHAESVVLGGVSYTPQEVIDVLGPLLTDERRARIAEVVAGRTCTVVPVVECLYDRGNVSAVVRSAEALGYQCLHNIDTSEKYRHAGRVTQGAEKWVDMAVWQSTGACLDHLREKGYRILATHFEDAQPLSAFDFTRPTALVFGNEKDGVSGAVLEAAEARVVLPMAGFVRSFNISVAAALCLYHVQQDRIRRQGFHGDLTPSERERLVAEFHLRSLNYGDRILGQLR